MLCNFKNSSIWFNYGKSWGTGNHWVLKMLTDKYKWNWVASTLEQGEEFLDFMKFYFHTQIQKAMDSWCTVNMAKNSKFCCLSEKSQQQFSGAKGAASEFKSDRSFYLIHTVNKVSSNLWNEVQDKCCQLLWKSHNTSLCHTQVAWNVESKVHDNACSNTAWTTQELMNSFRWNVFPHYPHRPRGGLSFRFYTH